MLNRSGWYYRRQFLQKRKAAIVIQKCWKSYKTKKSYLVIKRGYYRLQALIRSRVLTSKFSQVRGMIVRLQARCRGFHVRRFQQKERWAVLFLQRQVRTWLASKRERRLRVTSEALSLLMFSPHFLLRWKNRPETS